MNHLDISPRNKIKPYSRFFTERHSFSDGAQWVDNGRWQCKQKHRTFSVKPNACWNSTQFIDFSLLTSVYSLQFCLFFPVLAIFHHFPPFPTIFHPVLPEPLYWALSALSAWPAGDPPNSVSISKQQTANSKQQLSPPARKLLPFTFTGCVAASQAPINRYSISTPTHVP